MGFHAVYEYYERLWKIQINRDQINFHFHRQSI